MKINEISEVAELMVKHELTEFLIESEGLKLSLKRGGKPVAMAAAPVYQPPPAAAAPAAAPAAPAPAAAPAKNIPSPIIGTFYAAPGPDQPPFVKVGDDVNDETVVCIIEAMKVMNEIKAGMSGRIKKVLVQNAKPVEFGQPLFEIE